MKYVFWITAMVFFFSAVITLMAANTSIHQILAAITFTNSGVFAICGYAEAAKS